MKRYKQRRLTALLLVTCLAVLVVVIITSAARPSMANTDWTEETYTVQQGDTLWSIAGRYCPDDIDRRAWVSEVRSLNGIDDCIIRPGEEITVLTAEGRPN